MLDVLQDDQDWYLTGGILQIGSVEIVEVDLGEVDDDRAVVTITLDASEVSVTAQGNETFTDYSQLIVTRFNLERADTWRIASTQSDE